MWAGFLQVIVVCKSLRNLKIKKLLHVGKQVAKLPEIWFLVLQFSIINDI